jgi:hypothetical protein
MAKSPAGAINIQAATSRASRKLAKTLAKAGVPKDVPGNQTASVRNVVREEVDREVQRVAGEVEDLKAARATEVGALDESAVGSLKSPNAPAGIVDPESAIDQKFDASTALGEARRASRLRVKKKIIDPLYEEARRVSDENPDVKYGVGNSKEALAKVKDPLRELGESEAPTKFFGYIEEWPTTGVDFATLQDARKTLGNAIVKLKKAGDFDGAQMLQDIRDGVIRDIENYDLVENVGTVAGGGPGGALGRAGAGPDSSVGVVDDASRRLVADAMDNANAGARALAEEFYEGTSGKIFKALRTKNPIALSHQMGMYLKHTGPGYPERVAELARIARGNPALGIPPSPELLNHATDWLVADAYARTVKLVKNVDGSFTRKMDFKALDTWKTNNAPALRAIPEAKRVTDDAEGLVSRARKLGAEPLADVAAANTAAFERYVDDPQHYWSGVAGQGPEKAINEINELAQLVAKSGDPAAWAGMKQSFWSSQWVRTFTAPDAVSPENAMAAISHVLDTPQLRHAVKTLYGDAHVRLLEKAEKLKRTINLQGKLAQSVNPPALKTGVEQAEELMMGSSFMSVIYGLKRRFVKGATAVDRFARGLDRNQMTALITESAENPPLLHEMLVREPADKIIKSIRTRMSLAAPSLFERVPASSENAEQRKEQIRKRDERKALDEEPANRGILSPPTASRSIINPALR